MSVNSSFWRAPRAGPTSHTMWAVLRPAPAAPCKAPAAPREVPEATPNVPGPCPPQPQPRRASRSPRPRRRRSSPGPPPRRLCLDRGCSPQPRGRPSSCLCLFPSASRGPSPPLGPEAPGWGHSRAKWPRPPHFKQTVFLSLPLSALPLPLLLPLSLPPAPFARRPCRLLGNAPAQSAGGTGLAPPVAAELRPTPLRIQEA